MYYYLLSRFIHWDENAQQNDPNYPHAKKNILIFMIGSVLYLFTAGFLWSKIYTPLINSILFLSIIRDFFPWFIFVDVIGCCILFKQFWGWGILSEVDGAFNSKNKPNSTIDNLNKGSNIIPQNKEVNTTQILSLSEINNIQNTPDTIQVANTDDSSTVSIANEYTTK